MQTTTETTGRREEERKTRAKENNKILFVKKEPANLIAKAHVEEDREIKRNMNPLLYSSLTKIVRQVGSRCSTNRGGNIRNFPELMKIRSKVHSRY